MFDPKHLAGASSDLVQSMVKVGRKAAELERVKLQTEIQKGKSEIRRKRLENKLKMSKEGGKGGPAKKTVKPKPEPEPMEDDDDNVLEDLVTTTETDKGQPSYSTLELGGFVTKGTDRKSRLDKRHAKIEAVSGPLFGAVILPQSFSFISLWPKWAVSPGVVPRRVWRRWTRGGYPIVRVLLVVCKLTTLHLGRDD